MEKKEIVRLAAVAAAAFALGASASLMVADGKPEPEAVEAGAGTKPERKVRNKGNDASAAALRISAMLGEKVGQSVGYSVKNEHCAGPDTRIIAMTPGKKHFAGCYLYNYGDCCELTDEEMYNQLELYYRFYQENKIDGVVVCSNNIADTGVKSVEIFRKFMAEHF